jgi:hypothetical protein
MKTVLKYTISLSIIILMFFAQGCNKDDNPTNPGEENTNVTIVSFSASPSAIPVQGDSVTVSWEVTGATSVIITPNIGAVSNPASGSVKVFVNSSTSFIINASNAANSASATAMVNAAVSTTISGFAKDFAGEPIAGAAILVDGKQAVTTSSDGSFTVQDVLTPYNITMILGNDKLAVKYMQVTKTNPTLLYIEGFTGSNNSATITGSVPSANGKVTRVFFVSGDKSWYATASQSNGNFTINARWNGSTVSYSGKLYVLRWTNGSNGLPSEYDAYGEKSLTISNGGSFNNNNFSSGELTDPADNNITGTVIKPSSNYNISNRTLSINFCNSSTYIGNESGSLSENLSFTVPNIAGASFGIEATASDNNKRSTGYKQNISGGTNGVTIPIEMPPQLSLPVDNATGVDTATTFLYNQGTGNGVNLVQIVGSSSSYPDYFIFTKSNSVTIPNLSSQGLGLPSNGDYGWQVLQISPLNSVDDAASESFISLINKNSGDVGAGVSEDYDFRTKSN